MGILKWYKRDPRAALVGMMGLTLEERGAYNTVLDLIYSHDGAVNDDPVEICAWLACSTRTWRRLRARLLDAGKLYVHAGQLHNLRADEEANFAVNLVNISRQKALKRWAEFRKINGLQDAVALTPTSTPTKLLSFLEAKNAKSAEKGNPK